MEKKLIGLIEAIKAAYALMFRNSHLGYLVKSIILTKLVMIPIMLLTWILLFNSILTFGQKVKSTLQPSITNYQYQIPTNNDYFQPNPNRNLNTKKAFSFNPLSLLVSLVTLAFGAITTIISLRAIHDVSQNQFQKIGDLFKGSLKFILPMIGLNILSSLIVGLGFVFLIIPGIILGYMFFFAPMILLYENVGPIEALKRSKNLVNGYKMNLAIKMFGGSLLMMLFLLPAMLTFMWSGMIIFELLMPFILLVQYVLYQDLRRLKAIPA